jgi:hypothetical protein
MDLRPILAAHRERAERDKDAIMTLVRGRVDTALCVTGQQQWATQLVLQLALSQLLVLLVTAPRKHC